jgi:hypothetical protein
MDGGPSPPPPPYDIMALRLQAKQERESVRIRVRSIVLLDVRPRPIGLRTPSMTAAHAELRFAGAPSLRAPF